LRSETEQVAAGLNQAGFDADWLNGDLPQRDRETVMARTREGKLRFLVATDVAARGIDISHLSHVINYSFPESPAVYVHRTGRTGRAGRTGCAISLASPQELGRLYYLRLEYKIFPVERTLPTRGELRTRREADRVAMLNEAFPKPPTPSDLALARRLLTHPDAERIVGGLLQTFFGSQGDEVDEQAAAARRSRRGTETGRAATHRERERASHTHRPAARASNAEEPDAEASPDAEGTGRRRRRRSPAGARRPDDESRPSPATLEPEREGHDDTSADTLAGEEQGTSDPVEAGALLYLDVGRRDGVRVSEIARVVREAGELRRAEVGKIRMRDRHTFVEVPEEKLDQVVERLRGQAVGDKTLSPERARVAR